MGESESFVAVGQLAADDILAHVGVKGMRWGVRKSDPPSSSGHLVPNTMTRKTKTGEVFTISKNPPNIIHKTFAKLSKNYAQSQKDGAFITIKDPNGKSIGSGSFWKKSDDELYLNWVTIDKSARGQGYATECLKAAKDFGDKKKFKKMTLEVPGNAPDARHIYEKMGFKVVKEVVDPNDIVWGGLTEMEYKFKGRS